MGLKAVHGLYTHYLIILPQGKNAYIVPCMIPRVDYVKKQHNSYERIVVSTQLLIHIYIYTLLRKSSDVLWQKLYNIIKPKLIYKMHLSLLGGMSNNSIHLWFSLRLEVQLGNEWWILVWGGDLGTRVSNPVIFLALLTRWGKLQLSICSRLCLHRKYNSANSFNKIGIVRGAHVRGVHFESNERLPAYVNFLQILHLLTWREQSFQQPTSRI